MKKRLFTLNKGGFIHFIKTLRKYKSVKQRLAFMSLSQNIVQRLKRKLALLEKRALSLNAKWTTGIATAVLVAWLATPVQAQFAAQVNLDTLGSNGLVLKGINPDDYSGGSVSDAGDINGDGIDDFIIGATYADPNGKGYSGESYVVFGSDNFTADSLNLSDLDGSNGFVLNGVNTYDQSGTSVSGAGDVNGDGIDDLIIGASFADPGGVSNAGQCYVVFGSTNFTSDSLNLADLNGTNGFTINGTNVSDYLGKAVGAAGDVNADGIDDFILGAHIANVNGNNYVGKSYVIFGSTSFTGDSLNLSDLDGSNGFVMNGIVASAHTGESVDGVGDINGDGIDDMIIGASGAYPNGLAKGGESYVVFGSTNFTSDSLNLADLDGVNGFVLNGREAQIHSGESVSGAGDVNGDGINDLIIGAWGADHNGNLAGESYIVFGSNNFTDDSLELSDLDGTNGFVMNGILGNDRSGRSVSGAGDVNGDGLDDVIIGAMGADPNGESYAGSSYIVFGSNTFTADSLNLSDLDGTNGFVVNGINSADAAGQSVSAAGDVNGDGIDDLIIGALWADPSGKNSAGESYVVFGKSFYPSTPSLIASPATWCVGATGNIDIAAGDMLRSAAQWVLYADSLNTTPLDSSLTGNFTLIPTTTTTYLVRGEGNGFTGEADSFTVTVNTSPTATISNNGAEFTGSPNGLNYQWIDCADNSIIVGETAALYTAVATGNFAVIVEDKGCADTSSCANVIIDGIEDDFGSQIQLFPNPTNNEVTLELGSITKSIITLSDITGQMITQLKSYQNQSVHLSLKDLPEGVYFVKVEDKDRQRVMKLIKQ